MVLDKLGESLKKTMSKLTGATYVDEKLINELVKDLQRALLQADVNVKLVFELSKNIKERAKQPAPPGLTKKEQIVNVLYEELSEFLGGEKTAVEIEKKPFVIMLVGLFGNGKCLHADSRVLLSSGESIAIEELYARYEHLGEQEVEDGYILELPTGTLQVPSFNPHTLKVEQKEVPYLWKLQKSELVEVVLDSANDFRIKTTPEHPFFVLRQGTVLQRRADQLRPGDAVATPRKVPQAEVMHHFAHSLMELPLLARVDNLKAKEIRVGLKQRFGTLKKAHQSLDCGYTYSTFSAMMKRGVFPAQLVDNLENVEGIRLRGSQKWISFPAHMNEELAEFVGYIIGDGFIDGKSVHIETADIEIVDRLRLLASRLFKCGIAITQDMRGSKSVHVRLHSNSLTHILHYVLQLPVGKKGRQLRVPTAIQTAPDACTKAFLRAYFDCDGHTHPKHRVISVVSESQQLLKDVRDVLLRHGIPALTSKKKASGMLYYRLSLNARQATRFARIIGSNLSRKQALMRYLEVSRKQGDGKLEMVPVADLLKAEREKGGYSLGQVQSVVSSYGLYEKKGRISRSQLAKLASYYESYEVPRVKQFLDEWLDGGSTSFASSVQNALKYQLEKDGYLEHAMGRTFLSSYACSELLSMQAVDVERLRTLAESDVNWVPVKSARPVQNDRDFVFDLTVPGNHSFISEGFVVHNTTTAGKLAKYYKTRGKSVAMISTDTWRPAAYEQLRQLGEQVDVPVFGDPNAAVPAEIYNHFKDRLLEHDVVLCDTAGRDALSDELVEEIKAIDAAVDADEKLLVIAAEVGQSAQQQAQMFHDAVGVTGVVVTRMDGTAKGGGALSACAVTGAPVKFLGTGEKVDALEEFKPKNFVSRLLGMGDLETLLEKAQLAIKQEDAEDLQKRMLKGEFTLRDLYQQMQAVKKMGPLSKVMEMIPGMSGMNIPKDALQAQEGSLERWKFIMDSMTDDELDEPEVLNNSRISRVAAGSGQSEKEIRALIKQHRQSKKMMKMMKGGGNEKQMQKLMKKMGKGGSPKLKF